MECNKWIDANEEIPDVYESVLVYTFEIFDIGFIDSEGIWKTQRWEDFEYNVEWWMRIEEPPENDIFFKE